MKLVEVIGTGLICAGAINVDEFYDNLLNSKISIAETETLKLLNYSNLRSGEVKIYNFGDNKIIYMLLNALNEALEDAKLSYKDIQYDTIIIGTSSGDQEQVENKPKNHDVDEDNRIINLLRDNINHKGSIYIISGACSASNHALADAYDQILNSSKENRIIVIGVEILSNALFEVFHSLKSLTSYENGKPFSKYRDGIIIGEGSGVIILEGREGEKKKKNHIYMSGYGLANDYYSLLSPDSEGRGLKRCYEQIFQIHNIDPKNIDFISAHGTGTILNDKFEMKAIDNIYGKNTPYILSIKNNVGHTMGAASIIESILCIKVLGKGIIPPNANLIIEDIDEECIGNLTLLPVHSNPKIAVNHSFAFGGGVSVSVFEKGD